MYVNVLVILYVRYVDKVLLIECLQIIFFLFLLSAKSFVIILNIDEVFIVSRVSSKSLRSRNDE